MSEPETEVHRSSYATITQSELDTAARDIVKLMVPVSFSYGFVVLFVTTFDFFQQSIAGTDLLPIPGAEEDAPLSDKLASTAVVTLVMLVAIVFMTCLMLVLLQNKFNKVLLCLQFLSPLLLLSMFSSFALYIALSAYDVAIDYVTFFLVIHNFSIVGLMSLVSKHLKTLQRIVIVIMTSLMSLVFLVILPNWAVWTVAALLVFWDLFAVLNESGPLRKIVDLMQERGNDNLPAQVYSAAFIWRTNVQNVLPKSSDIVEPDNGTNQEQGMPIVQLEDEQGSVELGLGDFVFYSVVIGKAASFGDWNAIVAVSLAILVGLAVTLFLLNVLGKALPALPIPIASALILFPITLYAGTPFQEALASKQVYI
ncbi:Presenilin sel-12 [Halotydeus destructor]|nr:Presenilin sel-12 [Halotydeus destructor]